MTAVDRNAISDDPVLPEAVVLALARRHVPSAKRVTGVDESGRKGRAYFIDDDTVLKTHRPLRLRARAVEEFETSLRKEAFFLRHMKQDPGIAMPVLLGYGRDAGVEYVCMTRMRGVSLRRVELSTSERATVLEELGATLRRIHGLPQAPFDASGLFPKDGPPAELRARLEALFSRIVTAIQELPEQWRIGPPAEEIARRALAALPETAERAALHSNPAGEHVFADPVTKRFVGLIDFGDAFISHPAFDLRPWRDPLDRAAIIAGYQREGAVDPNFLATWRVGLVLGELASALRGRAPLSQHSGGLRLLLEEL